MKTNDMSKELGLFSVTVYIQWYQFIIVQVNLSTPYNQVTSNFMLGLKSLHLNLLNIVTLLTLNVVIGDHPTRLKKISTILKSKFSKSTLKETGLLLSQLSVPYKKLSQIIHQRFLLVLIPRLKVMAIKGPM